MGVPTTGSYEMFGTASTLPIAGAIVEGGGDVSGVTAFTGSQLSLISSSFITQFDSFFSKGAVNLTDVDESLHYRGYPINDCNVSSSAREIYLAPGQIEVNYQTSFMSTMASGSIEANGFTSENFITQFINIGDNITATASAHSNSTFKGWSYTPASLGGFFGFGRSFAGFLLSLNSITSSVHFSEIAPTSSITYYAIFDTDIVKRKYCYLSHNNRNDICSRCNSPRDVFYRKGNFTSSAIDDITWYNTSNITGSELAPTGYYYLSGSTNPQVYEVINGQASKYIVCDGTTIFCS